MTFLAAVAPVLVMWVFAAAATAPIGTPAAVRYITDDKVSAAMAKGGPVLQDPGLAIVAGRAAPSAAAIDPTTHHIFLIQQGEATLVTGGRLAGKTIEGGQNRRLKTGDMIVIPARTPYWWKEVPSGTVTNNAFGPKEAIGYIAINMDDPR